MTEMITVYVSAAADHLEARAWADYCDDIHAALLARAARITGVWRCDEPPGVCWRVRIDTRTAETLRAELAAIRAGHTTHPAALAWAEAPTTLYL